MNATACKIPGCARHIYAKGWCNKHWQTARRHNGDPLGSYHSEPPLPCMIPWCSDPFHARGWCYRHYCRALAHGGDPLGGRVSPGEPLAYFWAHVDDVTDDCVTWPFGTSGGYGVISIDGHLRRVPVLACERHHGPRPAGMFALHAPLTCHNPLCFNARGGHVGWGTPGDNNAHMLLDDTIQTGERNCNAKLTRGLVAELRLRYAAGGISQRALATEYGVAQGQIWAAANGRTWKAI